MNDWVVPTERNLTNVTSADNVSSNDISLLKPMGHPGLFFIYFWSFQATVQLYIK